MDRYKQVHIIYQHPESLKHRHEEFGFPTTFYPLDTRGMINYFLMKWAQADRLEILTINWIPINDRIYFVECVSKDPAPIGLLYVYRMKISHGGKNEKIDFETPTLTIDMTKLYGPSGKLAYLNSSAGTKP